MDDSPPVITSQIARIFLPAVAQRIIARLQRVAKSAPMQSSLSRLRSAGQWLLGKGESLAQRAPLCFSLLMIAVLFAAVFLMLAPAYQSNDDPQLAMIAAGKGTCDAPNEHLIYTNILIGLVLKYLYTNWPSMPWYGIYLYAVQYFEQVAILYCAIGSKYTRLRMGLFLLWFITVGVSQMNCLQFTMTALLAGQSGALLCLMALRRLSTGSRVQVRTLLSCGATLLVLASMIRLECFYLTCLVMAPVALLFLDWPLQRKVIAAGALTAGTCLAFVCTLAAYNDAHYTDPEWQNFFAYNKLRTKFNDYAWISYTPETAHVFDQANWSENDQSMIALWFYDDPALYSETRLRQVLESYPWQSQRLTLDYWLDCARGVFLDRPFLGPLCLFPLFFCCTAWSKRAVWAILTTIATVLCLLVFTALFIKQPPTRVSFPVLTCPLMILLLLSRESVQWPKRKPIIALAHWLVAVFDRANTALVVKKFNCESSADQFAERIRQEGIRAKEGHDRIDADRAVTAAELGRVVVMPPLELKGRFARRLSFGKRLLKAIIQPRPVHVLVAVTVIGLIYGVTHHFRRNDRILELRGQLNEFFANLDDYPGRLFVMCVPDFPYEGISPLDNLSSYSNLPQLVVGWPQHTPFFQAAKQKYGVSNVLEALYDRPDVYFVCDMLHREVYEKFIREHQWCDVRFVSKLSNYRFDVGQFRRELNLEATAGFGVRDSTTVRR